DVGGRRARVLDGEGGVVHAEEAGADALSGAADADECGQSQVLGGDQGRGDRADGGVLDNGAGHAAGVHQGGATVVADLVGCQPADDGELVHLAGDGGEEFADVDAADVGLDLVEDIGLGTGLEVPQVNGGGSAPHPHDDETLVL